MNPTSSDWLIERNKLIQNRKGIRIAADQDHGVQALAEKSFCPHDHRIQHNDIRDNFIGIELENVEETEIQQNTSKNLVAEVDER
jgi:nitrous oxidase accessory protein NosD